MFNRWIKGPAQPVVIVGSGRRAEDPSTGALSIIRFVHHEVHEGNTFQASYKSPDAAPIADNAAVDFLLIAGDVAEPHFVFSVACGGDCEVEFYEGTTVTNNGAALQAFNMHRHLAADKIATMRVFQGPTVNVIGLRLQDVLLPGGTGPAQSPGGTARPNTEWVLHPGVTYLLRVTNRAGAAQPVSILVQWYELVHVE